MTFPLKISLLLPFCLLAAGCSVQSTPTPPTTPVPVPVPPTTSGQIDGKVLAGQQPLSDATIQLFAAGTSGYGTGAVSLLSTPVTTAQDGTFSLIGDYTCPSASSQLYVLATGGNPGLTSSTSNSASVMMAALGPCTLFGSTYTLDPNAYININEVTTVASVYALAAFINPTTLQVGTSSTNATGLTNAFLTVPNLVDISTGQARTATLAANGTVPQSTINSLGNTLDLCIKSNGTGTPCSTLFAAATSTGATAPTNTLQAVLNIATHPASQAAALYQIATTSTSFSPALTAAPNDWTLSVPYKTSNSLQTRVALDADGNVWINNTVSGAVLGRSGPYSSVFKLSNQGAFLSPAIGYFANGFNALSDLAVDPTGNVWLTDSAVSSVYKLSTSGTVLATAQTGISVPNALAIDGAGNAWIANNNGTLAALSNSAVKLPGSPFTGSTLPYPTGMAIDPSSNIWIADYSATLAFGLAAFNNAGTQLPGSPYLDTNLIQTHHIASDSAGNIWLTATQSNTLHKFTPNGVPTQPGGYTGGGLNGPASVAIDGAGNAWVANGADSKSIPHIVEFSNAGLPLSGSTGYASSPVSLIGATPADDLAIDSSGNVWTLPGGYYIIEYIGTATPVATPFSLAIKNNKLAQKP
ncbi:Vgb family protein [Granulicella tundricola]|uniref:NHL repeat containing protein n=1 Tax=Granulicella tundricola (strain ATCC BAA-1859 / DSM 23138 / MP5ACTX9) TaxID=1198114 RepID=E8X2Z5_GRATM|nr:hypothetical protein [Granulicella tundricola]ADW68129.1 NHL repeat containing protein [Granulicella tundricola MP5ACTX9]